MKKQWLSIVLVLCMVLCMVPTTARAEESKTCELKITVEVNGLIGSAEGAEFTFQIKKAINEVTAQYYEYGTMTVTVGADGTTGTNTIAVEEGKYIVQQVGPGDPIGEYVWYSISYTGGNNESGPQSVYGDGNSITFKVYNTYKPANVTKVTTLPITVTGYKADAKIADAAVTTTEPGIKLSYFQFMEKDSAGDWTSAPLTGTFKADTEYRVEVYFNKLLGCDYTGLKKENVTVNGVEADAFETTWSGFPYNKDYQVIRGLGKPEVVKTVESIEITKQPDKIEYMAGEDFDPTGMVVTAHYTDGTTADLPETGYTIFRGTGLMQGQTDVTIQYNDGSGSSNIKTYQNITVKPYVGPHTHTYGGPWYADAKSHWHQCTDSACPDPSGSTKDLASHTFVWKVDQAATTTQTGLKHEECTVCSYKRSENTVIDKLPATHSHSYGTEWKYDDTNHWHECECGDKADIAVHSASEWIVDTAATETADGAKHKECTVCKKVLETATIPATHSHSYGTEWKYDDTNHWHECECGDKADIAVHSASEWIVDTAATETADGAKHKECTVCKKVLETATIPATHSHSYGTDWKYDDTNHWHECECGDKADIAAHSASEWIIDTAATETADGAKHKECTVCKKVLETATIPATHSHSYGTDWKYDDTNHWHECECGDKADIAAHSASEWIIDTAATETADGAKHKECTVCKKVLETATIPATHSHSYGTDWKYDDTNHWHECECGDKADTAAHSFQWVIDKAATKEATGIKHEECTVCGAKRSENTVIDKLPDSGNTGNTGSGDNNTDKPGKDDSTKSPQTGDSSNLIGWLAALFVSGGVLTVLGVSSKKRKESEAE